MPTLWRMTKKVTWENHLALRDTGRYSMNPRSEHTEMDPSHNLWLVMLSACYAERSRDRDSLVDRFIRGDGENVLAHVDA